MVNKIIQGNNKYDVQNIRKSNMNRMSKSEKFVQKWREIRI